MNHSTSEYVEQEVANADPAKLVDLLFQRAVRDLEQSCEMWPALARSAEAVRLALHAQAIIGELQSCLNFNEGGDLATNLGRLYEYMQFRLTQALTNRRPEDAKSIAEVATLMAGLSSAWTEMSTRARQEGTTASLMSGASLVA